MALIYASAVNKRINGHYVTRCKRSTVENPNCGLQEIMHSRQSSNEDSSEVPLDLSKASLSNKKHSRRGSQQSTGTVASCSSSISKFSILTESIIYSFEKSIHRSRTSCNEIKRKATVPNAGSSGQNIRKISTPIMGNFTTSLQSQSPKSKHNKQMVKKRVIQEYNLDLHPNTAPKFEDFEIRRKSQSLGPDDWHKQVTLATAELSEEEGASDNNRKMSAFQRVRHKFAKWRSSKTDDIH